jgi:2-dehydropantoate 2-reductase
MWNGTFNCICAITGLDTHGAIFASQASEIFISEVLKELFAAACGTLGRKLDDEMRDYALPLTKKLSPIVPSMLQDARKNAEMEVEALCGNIWRAAEAHGVETPRIQ